VRYVLPRRRQSSRFLLHPHEEERLVLTLPSTAIRLFFSYRTVHVFISVKAGTEEAFKAASMHNARNSALEPGIARFDVLQDQADPTKFVLVEVYKTAEAPAAHKETAHYAKWRETVEDMMAAPRQACKYDNLFPLTTAGWDYPATSKLE
jgi:autoinducer 2-degrading protein